MLVILMPPYRSIHIMIRDINIVGTVLVMLVVNCMSLSINDWFSKCLFFDWQHKNAARAQNIRATYQMCLEKLKQGCFDTLLRLC